MTAETKKYSITFSAQQETTKREAARGFYELAKKHIVKGRRGGANSLSEKIDKIVYGV